jgi:hypothetical protein
MTRRRDRERAASGALPMPSAETPIAGRKNARRAEINARKPYPSSAIPNSGELASQGLYPDPVGMCGVDLSKTAPLESGAFLLRPAAAAHQHDYEPATVRVS